MTIALEWESKKLLVIRYQGLVTGRDLLNVSLKISGDARLDDLRFILSDWSQVKKTKVSMDDVEELVAYISAIARTNSNIKNASVTRDTEEGRALVAFYHHLSEGISWQMKYCATEQEARAWFGEA